MVEMKVAGLALDEKSQVPVLVLKDAQEMHTLPIWIGAMEAMAISLVLNEVTLPRPMTHDLLLNMVDGLGGNVHRVDITRIDAGTYYAEIIIHIGEEEHRIDSRPSDAVALALRADCSIHVAEQVLDSVEADVTLGKPEFDSEEADKWTELLEDLEDDTKYKM